MVTIQLHTSSARFNRECGMNGSIKESSQQTSTTASRPVPVPTGWDRCDQSGSLRGICAGAVTEPRPELTKRDWEAQDPPRKPGTFAAGPGYEGTAARDPAFLSL